MTHVPRSRRVRRLTAAASLAVLAGAWLAPAASAGTKDALDVGVGVGRGTIAGNVFAPGEVTVGVGAAVTFTITSDEVHTVTLGQPPEGFQPPGEVAGWQPPQGPPPWDFGAAEFDGSQFLNTAIAPAGSKATVRFTAAGEFPVLCIIHPGMEARVIVSDDADATTQDEADAAARQTEDAVLAQVDGLREKAAGMVREEKRDDGTSLWTVPAGVANEVSPQPGGGTGYLEIMEFFPETRAIRTGDAVRWESPMPHTVTFLAEGQTPDQVDPFSPPAKPSEEYDGSSLYHSGPLGFAPGAPNTFELTFARQGSYDYVCLLHYQQGMTGAIAAGVPDTATEDPAPLGPALVLAGSVLVVLGGFAIALGRTRAGTPV
jgi:plastocyanin